MKITLSQLKKFISEAVEDVKSQQVALPYQKDEKLDFSKQPHGGIYARQGTANFGPYTEEAALRYLIGQMIAETNGSSVSGPQAPLCNHVYKVKETQNIWEQVQNLVEAVCEKCGGPVMEKHVGFARLKNKLAHKKGVTDPAALAASIGRKKYGAKNFQKKAAAGRKK
jgi:hypothetical protein